MEFVEESKTGNRNVFVCAQPNSAAIKIISATVGFIELPLFFIPELPEKQVGAFRVVYQWQAAPAWPCL